MQKNTIQADCGDKEYHYKKNTKQFYNFQAGCGDQEYIWPEKGATFPGKECPDELPDLKDHANFLTDTLKKNPELYKANKDKTTKLGKKQLSEHSAAYKALLTSLR
jgi:hypothetical protein